MKHKWKVFLILGVEFVAILLMLAVIFFAGKKSYTVTFDLNGGTLLSGEVVQRVTQGQSAHPPTVVKDGCYFLEWSGSYRQVTRDVTVKAIWEYETTVGILYSENVEGENGEYCEIIGCYKDLAGDVYIGAYHNGKKVLGIRAGAFEGCENITNIHMLDGILAIEDGAFAGCTSLESIEMPPSLIRLGDGVFEGCTSLESISLPVTLKKMGNEVFKDCTSLEKVSFAPEVDQKPQEDKKTKAADTEQPCLQKIGERAFENCIALKNIELPNSLREIGSGAFAGCKSLRLITLPVKLVKMGSGVFDQADLKIQTYFLPAQQPDGWAEDWCLNDPEIEWGCVKPEGWEDIEEDEYQPDKEPDKPEDEPDEQPEETPNDQPEEQT